MSKTSTYQIATKRNESSPAISTSLTIEWDVDEAGVRELASKTVIIAWQRLQRTSTTPIPSVDVIKASESGKRKVQVVVVERKYEDMTLEELEAAQKRMQEAMQAKGKQRAPAVPAGAIA